MGPAEEVRDAEPTQRAQVGTPAVMPGVVQAPEEVVAADDVGHTQRFDSIEGGHRVEDGLHQDGCATGETGHGSAESEDTRHG
jgi:hypothetical protein